jgi:hypothetical protein
MENRERELRERRI